jgi:hypothetical protein
MVAAKTPGPPRSLRAGRRKNRAAQRSAGILTGGAWQVAFSRKMRRSLTRLALLVGHAREWTPNLVVPG